MRVGEGKTSFGEYGPLSCGDCGFRFTVYSEDCYCHPATDSGILICYVCNRPLSPMDTDRFHRMANRKAIHVECYRHKGYGTKICSYCDKPITHYDQDIILRDRDSDEIYHFNCEYQDKYNYLECSQCSSPITPFSGVIYEEDIDCFLCEGCFLACGSIDNRTKTTV